jgi:hypothetical protein
VTPVTILCVWVHGHVPFTADYVTRLASMVQRHMDRPCRFVCLCDKPYQLARTEGIEKIQIPKPDKSVFGWWSKLSVFDPSHGFTGRMLYLDLDTLVVKSLAPILDYPSPFALIPDAGNFQGRGALAVVKRFNSSVMVWDAGVNAQLWEEWSPAVAKSLWGDQDWISEQMPQADTMPAEWFPRLSELHGQEPGKDAKVVLVKKPKNSEAVKLHPWVAEAWR